MGYWFFQDSDLKHLVKDIGYFYVIRSRIWVRGEVRPDEGYFVSKLDFYTVRDIQTVPSEYRATALIMT